MAVLLYNISMDIGAFSGVCGAILTIIIGFSSSARKETSSREDRKHTKKQVSTAFVGCILIALLLVSTFIIMQFFKHSGMVPKEVPSVEGNLYAYAVGELQEADFLEKVICEDDSEGWSNYVVIEQKPAGGETALTKTKVKLYLAPAGTRTEESDTQGENPVAPQILSSIVLGTDLEFIDASISPTRAYSGDSVELHISGIDDYGFDLTLIDENGTELPYEREDWVIFTFTMPDCDVTAYLSKAESGFDPMIPPEPVVPETVCDYGLGCPTRTFSDLDPDEWYHEAVDFVVENNLLSGYSGAFSPDGTVSRAEAATIFCKMTGWPDAITFNTSFTDVSDDAWYAAAVSWAVDSGIIGGYDDNTFRPDEPVTTEQFITMLW